MPPRGGVRTRITEAERTRRRIAAAKARREQREREERLQRERLRAETRQRQLRRGLPEVTSVQESLSRQPIQRQTLRDLSEEESRRIRESAEAGGFFSLDPRDSIGLLKNIGTEAKDIAAGLPGFVVEASRAIGSDIEHPLRSFTGESAVLERVVEPAARYYKERYVTPFQQRGFRGGLAEIDRQFYENPVSGALDIFAAASVGTSLLKQGATATKIIAKGGPPGQMLQEFRRAKINPRNLVFRPDGSVGVVVHPRSSPNPLTRYFEGLYDDFTAKHPDKRLIGAASRVGRIKSKDIHLAQRRARARVSEDVNAIKRISFDPIQNAKLRKRLAWEAQLAPEFRGGEGLVALRSYYEGQLANASGRSARKIRRRLKDIDDALSVTPTPKYQAALDAARRLSDETQQIKLDAGLLDPEQAAQRGQLVGREIGLTRTETTTPLNFRDPYTANEAIRSAPRAQQERMISLWEKQEQLRMKISLGGRKDLVSQLEGVKQQIRDLAQLEAPPPAEIIPGSDIHFGHRARTSPVSVNRAGRSRVGPGAASTRGMGLEPNELVLFRSGRLRIDPDVIVEDWLRAQTFEFHSRVKQFFGDVSQPIGPDGPNPGWYVVNPEGKTTPGFWKDAVESADNNSLYEAALDYARNYIGRAGTESASKFRAPDGSYLPGVTQLDPSIAHKFFNHYIGPQGAGANLGAVATGFDIANGLVKTSLLYANPAYIPANFFGNLVFLGLHEGPFALPNLVRAGKDLLTDHELSALVRAEVGMGPTEAIAAPARVTRQTNLGRAALEVERGAARTIGAIPDVWPRMAAWYFEARKHGYRTKRQQTKLLKDPALETVRNEISNLSQQAMVDFGRLGPVEQGFTKRVFFVWPWIRGSTAWAARFPLDRPARASVVAQGSNRATELANQLLGPRPAYAESIVPLDEEQTGDVRTVLNLASLNPAGSFLEFLQMAPSIAGPGLQDRTVFDMLNPAIEEGINVARGQTRFGETVGSVPAAAEAAKNLSPLARLYEDVRTPDQESKIYAEDDPVARRLIRGLPIDVRKSGLNEAARKEIGKPKTLEQRVEETIDDYYERYAPVLQANGEEFPDWYREAITRRLRINDRVGELRQELYDNHPRMKNWKQGTPRKERFENGLRLGALAELYGELQPEHKQEAIDLQQAARGKPEEVEALLKEFEGLLYLTELEQAHRRWGQR